MKKILLSGIIAGISVFSGFSQNRYAITGKSSDEKTIREDSILVRDGNYIFSVQDINGIPVCPESCNWSFEGLRNDSTFISVFIGSAGSEYNMEIRVEQAVDMARFASLKRYRFEGDNSVYFRAKIVCEIISPENQKIMIELPVFLNVLPSIPEIILLAIDIPAERKRCRRQYDTYGQDLYI